MRFVEKGSLADYGDKNGFARNWVSSGIVRQLRHLVCVGPLSVISVISVSSASSHAVGAYTTADIELIWTGTGEVNRRASAIGGTAVVESRRPLPLPPDVDRHGNFDGVIESRSEIPHRTLDL
jgi:hypothetical protein